MIVHIKFQVHTKCLNLVAVANMSEKNTSRFMGGVHPPLWGATETTFHLSEKWKILTIDAWDNFENTGKKPFSYLKERSQKSKKIVKCTPPTHKSFSH